MNKIFKYSASINKQNNTSGEIAERLPHIFAQELHAVVARDIRVHSSTISFHGGASRTAPKRHRSVTNWNLLTPISRGAIHVGATYSQLRVNFWLGFPKWVLFATILFIVGIVILLTTVFLSYGEPFLDIFFAVSLVVVAASIWLGILPFTISIIRFHLFVRTCIRKVEKEIEENTYLA